MIFKLTSIVLLVLLQNIICDDKFPGFTETYVGKIEVYYKTRGSVTEFNIVAPHETSAILSETNSWISVAFNSDRKMDKSSAVVCKSTSNGKSVQHYYNNRTTPQLIDPANPQLGLTNTKLIFDGQYIICSFTRNNSNNNPRYFNINNNPFILTAWGSNRFTGPQSDMIAYHGNQQRDSSPTPVNILSSANNPSATTIASMSSSTTTNSNSQTTKSSASSLISNSFYFLFSSLLIYLAY